MAKAMNKGHMPHCEFRKGLLGQLVHLLQRHLFIGFVIEVERAAAARVVAHDTVEDYDSAVLSAPRCCCQFFSRNNLASQGDYDWRGLIMGDGISSAGDGWQQADFVAVAEQVGGGGVLRVHADGNAAQRRSGVLQLTDTVEQVADGGAFRQFQSGYRGTEPVFQYAKGKNSYTHRWIENTACGLDAGGWHSAFVGWSLAN